MPTPNPAPNSTPHQGSYQRQLITTKAERQVEAQKRHNQRPKQQKKAHAKHPAVFEPRQAALIAQSKGKHCLGWHTERERGLDQNMPTWKTQNVDNGGRETQAGPSRGPEETLQKAKEEAAGEAAEEGTCEASGSIRGKPGGADSAIKGQTSPRMAHTRRRLSKCPASSFP
ncbi:MAG: hypothetical protein LQ350_008261, partial [Teloschistes chrysophthalmus]